MFSLKVLGQRILFLNSAKAAQDLLEKRSFNYSDRSQLHMINDLCVQIDWFARYLFDEDQFNSMGWDWGFGMMKYGPRWKKHRKMFDSQFRASQASAFWPIQKQRAHTLIQDLLKSPSDLTGHLRQ